MSAGKTPVAGEPPTPAKEHADALARATDAARAAKNGPAPFIDRRGRTDAGHEMRKVLPRSAHGEWQPAPDRRDPVAVLEEQGTTRVQDLLPIRYGRMAESAFGFYRGAAAGMAADLAGTPDTGLRVQLCGDAHLVNFGAFGTPERRLIFDVNDFDETLPGPWEWDLKRLGASFAVAVRSKGWGNDVGDNAVTRVALTYAGTLQRLASAPTLDAWYWSVDTDALTMMTSGAPPGGTVSRGIDKAIARAHAHNMLQAVGNLTVIENGRRRFIDQLPLVGHVPGADELAHVASIFAAYRASLPDVYAHLLDRFELVDAARKVVGVGSVGTRCWIALLDGGGGENDAIILQIKEAEASVLEQHLEACIYANHGQRVVQGQRLMQAASDIFLGWTHDEATGCHYYWRQLHDMKGSVNVATLPVEMFVAYADLCGVTLARAHARSGDVAAISGYLGKGNEFAKALARFAQTYADQNERDHAALVQAVADGRLHAETGV